jgi:glycosyltransferase involved in cell wall biosynthesis
LLGNNHGISVLVDVAREMPELDFIIVGDGPEETLIREKLEKAQIKNLHLLGYCTDQAELIRYYQEADLLINHTKDRPVLNRTVVPAKFSEYMATGKPMVYAGKGLAIDFLDPIGCAEIVEPESPESIAAAIRRLLDNPERARAMGQRGRVFVMENCLREDLMQKYVSEIVSRLL